jgi:phosphotransferase system  glucose/maltose/N-acetylglucosamine-specific IIC component
MKLSKIFYYIMKYFVIACMSFVYYGFIAPALISSTHNELVAIGIFLCILYGITVIFLIIYDIKKIYKTYF